MSDNIDTKEYEALRQRMVEAEQRADRAESALRRKTKECELIKQARDRYMPCPGHRDKATDDDECQMCRAEQAEAERDEFLGKLGARTQRMEQSEKEAAKLRKALQGLLQEADAFFHEADAYAIKDSSAMAQAREALHSSDAPASEQGSDYIDEGQRPAVTDPAPTDHPQEQTQGGTYKRVPAEPTLEWAERLLEIPAADGHAEATYMIEKVIETAPVVSEPDNRVFRCAKCGYGSEEHGMTNHPAYQCVSDMRLQDPAPADAPASERNQCDGCRRGWPIDAHGIHQEPEGAAGIWMVCTADRYNTDPADRPETDAAGEALERLLYGVIAECEGHKPSERKARKDYGIVRQSLSQPAPDVPEKWRGTVDRIVPDIGGDEPDEEEHVAEWALWHDRKRIRNELFALPQSEQAVPEPQDWRVMEDLITALELRGIDTSLWDGEDGPIEAVANGIAKAIGDSPAVPDGTNE